MPRFVNDRWVPNSLGEECLMKEAEDALLVAGYLKRFPDIDEEIIDLHMPARIWTSGWHDRLNNTHDGWRPNLPDLEDVKRDRRKMLELLAARDPEFDVDAGHAAYCEVIDALNDKIKAALAASVKPEEPK